MERAGGEARISKLANVGAFNAGALIGNAIQLFNKILIPKRNQLPSLSTIGDGEGPEVRRVGFAQGQQGG